MNKLSHTNIKQMNPLNTRNGQVHALSPPRGYGTIYVCKEFNKQPMYPWDSRLVHIPNALQKQAIGEMASRVHRDQNKLSKL
jgi:hypothetical protein